MRITAADIPAGTLVFRECGCAAICGVSPPDGPMLIVVLRPCPTHGHEDDRPRIEYLTSAELVRPFSPFDGL